MGSELATLFSLGKGAVVASVLELDVSGAGTPGTYRVEVLQSPGGEAAATFQLRPTEMLDRLDEFQQTLLASSVPSRGLRSRGETSVRTVGRRLFDALFAQQDVAGVYRASCAVAEERGDALRIVLRINAPELVALPWESMFDPVAGSYVSRREPLVRYVAVPSAPPPREVRLPLRILAVAASPRGLAALDVEKERENLTRALRPLTQRGAVEMQWLDHATWAAMQDALLADTWHIVHFIGHGDFDIERDEGVLALETEEGRIHRVPAEAFVDLLRQAQPMPRLVVLNACESGASGWTDMFAGAAATLVRGGVSAVTAMQFEISDQAAIAFCQGFYTAIGRGRGVDEAVRSGRVAIVGSGESTLEWITPTLYLRGRQTYLFALSDEPARPAPAPVPAGRHRQAPVDEAHPLPAAPPPAQPPAEEPGRSSADDRPRRRWPLVLAGAGLLAAALAILTTVLLTGGGGSGGGGPTASAPSATPSPTPGPVSVVVDGVKDWTDTGIDVRAGDRIAVVASGQVFHNETSSIGPEGFPNRPDLLTPYPQWNHAALIGRVGENGSVFLVQGARTVTAEADGRLFLGINDGGLENNRGSWDATVAVDPRGG